MRVDTNVNEGTWFAQKVRVQQMPRGLRVWVENDGVWEELDGECVELDLHATPHGLIMFKGSGAVEPYGSRA